MSAVSVFANVKDSTDSRSVYAKFTAQVLPLAEKPDNEMRSYAVIPEGVSTQDLAQELFQSKGKSSELMSHAVYVDKMVLDLADKNGISDVKEGNYLIFTKDGDITQVKPDDVSKRGLKLVNKADPEYNNLHQNINKSLEDIAEEEKMRGIQHPPGIVSLLMNKLFGSSRSTKKLVHDSKKKEVLNKVNRELEQASNECKIACNCLKDINQYNQNIDEKDMTYLQHMAKASERIEYNANAVMSDMERYSAAQDALIESVGEDKFNRLSNYGLHNAENRKHLETQTKGFSDEQKAALNEYLESSDSFKKSVDRYEKSIAHGEKTTIDANTAGDREAIDKISDMYSRIDESKRKVSSKSDSLDIAEKMKKDEKFKEMMEELSESIKAMFDKLFNRGNYKKPGLK